MYIMMGV